MQNQKQNNFTIRYATREDSGLILNFIQQLAEYEKMEDQVAATEAKIQETLFDKNQAEVIFGELDGNPIAFALFFENYSTFLGQANMYLEDLFLLEAYRGRGYGRSMFRALAQIAVERGYARLDWWCLDWNEPSIAFYKRMGAAAMDEWTVYRLDREGLRKLAE